MKITWLVKGDESGGVRSATLHLMVAVRETGWKVAAVSVADGPFLADLAANGLPTTSLHLSPPPQLSGSLAHKAVDAAGLWRYQRRAAVALTAHLQEAQRPDALHVLWPNLMPLAARAAHALGVHCFWEMPNAVGRYPLGINRRLLQRTLHRYHVTVLANSRYTASTLGSHPVAPVVMHLGAEENRFNPATVLPVSRAELGLPADAIVLGMFARITPLKGPMELLQAVARVGDSRLHVLLVGLADAGFAEELSAEALRLGLPGRLHQAGHVGDVERYYAAVDIAVNCPPRSEPFGLSVVEAMLMGKPVLAHALGGPGETVVDGETGWLFQPATAETIAAAIRRALSSHQQWPAMGQRGLERARKNYTLSRQCQQYLAIVSGMIGASP